MAFSHESTIDPVFEPGCLRPPADPELRGQMDDLVARAAASACWVPPMSLVQLRGIAGRLLAESGLDPVYTDYLVVLINNHAWLDYVAAVPFERRLLLLPRCLRDTTSCQGTMDAFGLLCADCGSCVLSALVAEAEALGYAVLVAEGSPMVASLIRSGRIESVVGVGCMQSLAKAFPLLECGAVPSLAVPLLTDGCDQTRVEVDRVRRLVSLHEPGRPTLPDTLQLPDQVAGYFTPEALEGLLGPVDGDADRLARQWLAVGGKRHRPVMAVAGYLAFRPDPIDPWTLRRLAVAVECFHKASLVHDDIEDDHATRYDRATLHAAEGLPIAINVGDLLIGQGYRLIGAVELPAERLRTMLQIACDGHQALCRGQGNELRWMRDRGVLTVQQVLGIFADKTSPAFEVALCLGALSGGADAQVIHLLKRFAHVLGVGYQIRDDLDDWRLGDDADCQAGRLSILPAVAMADDHGMDVALIRAWWFGRLADTQAQSFRAQLAGAESLAQCSRLMRSYRDQALALLEGLDNAPLKAFLRRMVGRVFDRPCLEGAAE